MPVFADRFAAIAAAARLLGRDDDATRHLRRIQRSLRAARSAYGIHRVISETVDYFSWNQAP